MLPQLSMVAYTLKKKSVRAVLVAHPTFRGSGIAHLR